MRKQEHIESGVTGWTAKLTDGTVATESSGVLWGDVKSMAIGLSLRRRDVEVILPDGQIGYVQGHSGTCSLSGGDIKIEGRKVGFITGSGDEVTITLPEDNNRIIVETTPCRRR